MECIIEEAKNNILKYKQYEKENKEIISNKDGDLNRASKKEDNTDITETKIKIPSKAAKNSEEEDLEEWLDDILDD